MSSGESTLEPSRDEPDDDVTRLLSRVRSGDQAATGELLSLAYDQLRGIAARAFRDQPGDHTLQPTALVNEVCVKLLRSGEVTWNDRQHFFRAAGRAMRNLLADHARAKKAQRRGGDGVRVSFDLSEVPTPTRGVDLGALDDSLTKLAALDDRLSSVFELRFLVGLSVTVVAEMLDVSPRTVELDTQFIRAWLQKELSCS